VPQENLVVLTHLVPPSRETMSVGSFPTAFPFFHFIKKKRTFMQKLKSVHSISPQLSQIVEYWQLSDLYFAVITLSTYAGIIFQ